MKYLSLIAASLLFLQVAHAQEELSYPHRYQFGIVGTDVVLPSLSFELSYYLDDHHSLGLYSSFHGMHGEDEKYSSINRGFSGGLFHRYIFSELASYRDEYIYIKHGARFTYASLNYSRQDWFPIYENGNEYLILEERSFQDNLSRFGYNLSIGLQQVHGLWYFEYYAGVKYENILNKEDLFYETQRNVFWAESRWLQEGFSPIVGIIVGFGFKP